MKVIEALRQKISSFFLQLIKKKKQFRIQNAERGFEKSG
jgi:hypothetical protein